MDRCHHVNPRARLRFRTLHRFDKVNNVACCAMFFCQTTKTHFRIAKLAFDHAKRMFNLGPHLRFRILNLATHTTDQTLFPVLLIAAWAGRNRPDHLSTPMCTFIPKKYGFLSSSDAFRDRVCHPCSWSNSAHE